MILLEPANQLFRLPSSLLGSAQPSNYVTIFTTVCGVFLSTLLSELWNHAAMTHISRRTRVLLHPVALKLLLRLKFPRRESNVKKYFK